MLFLTTNIIAQLSVTFPSCPKSSVGIFFGFNKFHQKHLGMTEFDNSQIGNYQIKNLINRSLDILNFLDYPIY